MLIGQNKNIHHSTFLVFLCLAEKMEIPVSVNDKLMVQMYTGSSPVIGVVVDIKAKKSVKHGSKFKYYIRVDGSDDIISTRLVRAKSSSK